MTVDRRAPHRRAPDAALYGRRLCHHPHMRATEHRIRPGRRHRRASPLAAAIVNAGPAAAKTPGLGLNAVELEDLLIAVGTLEDQAGTDQRARLARGRAALELELARTLNA